MSLLALFVATLDTPPVTVTIPDTSLEWESIKEGYIAGGDYVPGGGTGSYVSTAQVNIVSGTVTSADAIDGVILLGSETDDTVTFTVTVTDSAGKSGTSELVTVSAP